MTQDSAEIARTFYDAWNERDFDRGAAIVTDDAELYEVATGERYRGPDGLRQEYEKWANAFPDGRVEIQNSFAAGDWAAFELRFNGTNTGSWVGQGFEMPATGKSVTFDFCTIFQLRDGRLFQARHYHDTNTIAQQLGLVPAEAAASA